MNKDINNEEKLSHWSEDGKLRMIDVSDKTPTRRVAKAIGKILLKDDEGDPAGYLAVFTDITA